MLQGKKEDRGGVSYEEIKNQCALKRENNCLLVRGNDLGMKCSEQLLPEHYVIFSLWRG